MKYDLEDRTLAFARSIRMFVKALPMNMSNREDISQLIRSSGSVGANYIEANASLGKKDFLMRMRISRKEAKESIYWLKLLDANGVPTIEEKRHSLIQEATELMHICGSIIIKAS